MNEPWFDPIAWAWLPGTVFGCAAGVWGTLMGIFAPRGKQRTLVLGMGMALLVAAIAFLVAGTVALITGQPYGIWYGFLLSGVVGLILLSSLLPVACLRYREVESRRIGAKDFEAD